LVKRSLLSGVVLSAALLWLVWPWLRPRLWPAQGAAWLVVLDGYHRLDAAIARQDLTGEAILLITCPATGQPTTAQRLRQRVVSQRLVPPPPLVVVEQGFDTATQATALAQWLQKRQRLGQAIPRQLHLVSDSHHFPRARWAAQIAAGGYGSEVLSLPVVPPASLSGSTTPSLDWPSWRDALRLQLWRATGSTGAVLNGHKLELKVQACAPSS
jgi:uncharacterized SAM-binding protein YcdF (DUF218 family)